MSIRVFVALVALSATLSATYSATDRLSYTFSLPPARTLSVAITIGHLRVSGGARSDAEIEIVRSAPTRDALLPIRVDESPTDVRIVGTQPAGRTDPALRTDVTIRVPHAATLAALRVTEGRISLSSLHGAVTADLRRGPIDATALQGVVRLETGIGDVTATKMRLSPQGLLRLRAFNGDVRLALAERPADARVMALALNGTIRSQIPLTMRETWGPRWGEATLGVGAPVISLDVITGVIEIEVP